jgi:hypothetical protein
MRFHVFSESETEKTEGADEGRRVLGLKGLRNYSIEELFLIFSPFFIHSIVLAAIVFMILEPNFPVLLFAIPYRTLPWQVSLLPLYAFLSLLDLLFFIFFVTAIFFGVLFIMLFSLRLREEILSTLDAIESQG